MDCLVRQLGGSRIFQIGMKDNFLNLHDKVEYIFNHMSWLYISVYIFYYKDSNNVILSNKISKFHIVPRLLFLTYKNYI